MGSLYGHKWVSSYGVNPDPDKVWTACLRGITEKQIKSALNQLAINGQEWPPSAPEFRKMCTGENEHWEHRAITAATESQKRLPKKDQELQRAEGKIQFAKLRESLRV